MIEETIGLCRLIRADCRDVLPGLRADAIITDPVWPNCPPDTIEGSNDPDGLWSTTCAAMPALSRLVVVMRGDSDPRFLRHVPARLEFFRSILLTYAMPSYIGRKLGGDEVAYWFGTPTLPARGRKVIPGRGPTAQPGDRPRNGRPMSRAQVHFDWLVQWATDPGETVIDPFMGSGTTMISCAKLQRPSIGIEVDPKFFDLACRRVEQAHRQGDMLHSIEAAE